jgi:hypothetical protein
MVAAVAVQVASKVAVECLLLAQAVAALEKTLVQSEMLVLQIQAEVAAVLTFLALVVQAAQATHELLFGLKPKIFTAGKTCYNDHERSSL